MFSFPEIILQVITKGRRLIRIFNWNYLLNEMCFYDPLDSASSAAFLKQILKQDSRIHLPKKPRIRPS